LAAVSGTGKTTFVRNQARIIVDRCKQEENEEYEEAIWVDMEDANEELEEVIWVDMEDANEELEEVIWVDMEDVPWVSEFLIAYNKWRSIFGDCCDPYFYIICCHPAICIYSRLCGYNIMTSLYWRLAWPTPDMLWHISTGKLFQNFKTRQSGMDVPINNEFYELLQVANIFYYDATERNVVIVTNVKKLTREAKKLLQKRAKRCCTTMQRPGAFA